MYKRVRLTPEQRKLEIIIVATDVAATYGLYNFSIANVSRAMVGCSKSTIKHYFSLSELRAEVVKYAVVNGPDIIVAQAITMNHSVVCEFDESRRWGYLKDV